MSARRLFAALKRFALGVTSGGAYPVSKAFEKEVRVAEREERRREERGQAAEDS
jgi:hypothetical protein